MATCVESWIEDNATPLTIRCSKQDTYYVNNNDGDNDANGPNKSLCNDNEVPQFCNVRTIFNKSSLNLIN